MEDFVGSKMDLMGSKRPPVEDGFAEVEVELTSSMVELPGALVLSGALLVEAALEDSV